MKEKVFMSWKWVDDQIDELAKRLKDKEKTSGIFYIITPKILHDNLEPNILLPEGLQTSI